MLAALNNNEAERFRAAAAHEVSTQEIRNALVDSGKLQFIDIYCQVHQHPYSELLEIAIEKENIEVLNHILANNDSAWVFLTNVIDNLPLIAKLDYPGKYKLCGFFKNAEPLIDSLSLQECDKLIASYSDKKCFTWNNHLLKRNLETNQVDGYNTISIHIHLQNLPLVDPTKIKKKTKKATIVVDADLEILGEHFCNLESIPNKFITFKSDSPLKIQDRILLQKLDCTLINPFYLYHDFDILPQKVIWKTKLKPPQELALIYPEFEVFRETDEFDLRKCIAEVNHLMREKDYSELRKVMEPLYCYELKEGDLEIIKSIKAKEKIILFPMISNPVISHLIQRDAMSKLNLKSIEAIDFERIKDYLYLFPFPQGIASKIAGMINAQYNPTSGRLYV